jgi:parallel beta-helix repeat protein
MYASGKAVAAAVIVSLGMIGASWMVLATPVAVGSNAPAVPAAVVPAGSAVSALAGPRAPVGGAPSVAPLADPPCTVTVSGENVGDTALQTAIDAASPGNTICVAAGVYPEQITISTPGLTIVGAGNASTIIEPNAPLALNTYDYDASGGPTSVPAAAIVLIEGTSGTPSTGIGGVALEDLQVDAAAAASSTTLAGCADGLMGVDFQASSGSLAGDSVTNVEMPAGLFGCQQGLAVYAYNGMFNFPSRHAPDTVNVTTSTVTAFDKNGVTCDDVGETCRASNDTITGIGPTTLIAQNGVQIAYGADAKVVAVHATGDAYSPTQNVDYFSTNEGNAPAGILVFDAGNSVDIDGNTLSGDTQGISVVGTSAVNVISNHILEADAYGITLDFNATSSYLYGLPLYSSVTPRTTVADDNTIENVNVAYLIYDDNVSISGGSAQHDNVSFESVLDRSGPSYRVSVGNFSAVANVSGALFGNVSSYQSTSGYYPKAVGTYAIGGDTFRAGPVGYPTGARSGIDVDAALAALTRDTVAGFDLGVYVNPSADTYVEDSNISEPASLGAPATGVWAGNVAPIASTTGSVDLENNTILGPGGTTASPFAGSSGVIVGGARVVVAGNIVDGFSGVAGSGSLTGYNWFQGTQSVGLLVGCTPTATACSVRGNELSDDAVGVAVLLTNAAFSVTYQTGPIHIQGNDFNDIGAYGIWAEMPGTGSPTTPGNGHAAPGTSVITLNAFDDSVYGAPAMVLDGGNFSVTTNVLVGTSATGDQGAAQAMPYGPIASCSGGSGGSPCIATASIEGSDTPLAGVTHVRLEANLFLGTSLYWSTAYAPAAGSTFSGGELVTFTESGLPGGTAWTIELNGTFGTVRAPAELVGQLQNGSGTFGVTPVFGYNATPTGGPLVVSGAPISEPISFLPTSYAVSFSETGLPASALAKVGWTVVVDGTAKSSHAATVTFEEATGTYPTLIVGPSGRAVTSTGLGCTAGHPASGCLHVGGPTSVDVAFAKGRTPTLTFHEKGLTKGRSWCAAVDLYSLCSTSASVKFRGLTAGTYNYSIATSRGQTVSVKLGKTAEPPSGPIDLTKATTLSVTFAYPYAVTFTETGLSSGTWSVTIRGVVLSNGSGDPIVFHLGNGSYRYSIGTEIGFSSSGTPRPARVAGAPLAVAVTFHARNGGHAPAPLAILVHPAPPARAITAGIRSSLAAPVGLTVGLLGAVLLGAIRVRTRSAATGR